MKKQGLQVTQLDAAETARWRQIGAKVTRDMEAASSDLDADAGRGAQGHRRVRAECPRSAAARTAPRRRLAAGLAAGGLLLLALAQIGLRVFFGTGLEWAEPVARMGVLWLALLGALGATRERRHIAIDALPRLLPPRLHRAAWAITQLADGSVLRAAGLVRLGHGRHRA